MINFIATNIWPAASAKRLLIEQQHILPYDSASLFVCSIQGFLEIPGSILTILMKLYTYELTSYM